jgi:hypothetical protein
LIRFQRSGVIRLTQKPSTSQTFPSQETFPNAR